MLSARDPATVETRETAAPATAGELLDLVRTGRASTRSQLRACSPGCPGPPSPRGSPR